MTKRRTKGEGSVFRRSDGRVVGEYVDANGKRRYVSGKNKPEVKAKLRKLLAERDEGIAYDSENLTVSAYLGRWLAAGLTRSMVTPKRSHGWGRGRLTESPAYDNGVDGDHDEPRPDGRAHT